MSNEELENVLKLMAAVAVFLTVTLPAFYLSVVKPIIAQLKEGQVKQQAAATIQIEQQNRYNETRGAEPVTMQSPPMGTGDGRRDAAVTDLLVSAPKNSAANASLTATDVARILVDELDRREAAKSAVPVAVVSEPPLSIASRPTNVPPLGTA